MNAVICRPWAPKLIYSPSGPVEVLLHLSTGWVLCPVAGGWVAVHSITNVFVCELGKLRLFADKTRAMLELASTCPDCYGVALPAPCATCEGTGKLGYDVDA